MSRIHLRSNTLVLWLSLSAAVGAASIGVGCSSSDSGTTEENGGASAGKGGKSGEKAGAAPSDAGDSSVGGSDTGTGGGDDMPGSGGKVAAGGAEPVADGGEPGEAGAAGAPTSGDDETAAAITRTKAVIAGLPITEQCPTCHQAKYDGFQYWPNITPDPTHGIGGEEWTDEKIMGAIHDGVSASGKTLCSQMMRYPFTAAQLKDFVIFLRNLEPSQHSVTTACPG